MTRNDYISRKAAIDALTTRGLSVSNIWAKAINEIELIPTADVQEVRHGKWLYNSLADHVYRICELCGAVYAIQEDECKYWFCPNCGADMRG